MRRILTIGIAGLLLIIGGGIVLCEGSIHVRHAVESAFTCSAVPGVFNVLPLGTYCTT